MKTALLILSIQILCNLAQQAVITFNKHNPWTAAKATCNDVENGCSFICNGTESACELIDCTKPGIPSCKLLCTYGSDPWFASRYDNITLNCPTLGHCKALIRGSSKWLKINAEKSLNLSVTAVVPFGLHSAQIQCPQTGKCDLNLMVDMLYDYEFVAEISHPLDYIQIGRKASSEMTTYCSKGLVKYGRMDFEWYFDIGNYFKIKNTNGNIICSKGVLDEDFNFICKGCENLLPIEGEISMQCDYMLAYLIGVTIFMRVVFR